MFSLQQTKMLTHVILGYTIWLLSSCSARDVSKLVFSIISFIILVGCWCWVSGAIAKFLQWLPTTLHLTPSLFNFFANKTCMFRKTRMWSHLLFKHICHRLWGVRCDVLLGFMMKSCWWHNKMSIRERTKDLCLFACCDW